MSVETGNSISFISILTWYLTLNSMLTETIQALHKLFQNTLSDPNPDDSFKQLLSSAEYVNISDIIQVMLQYTMPALNLTVAHHRHHQ
jgi:hypothetical protein